MEMWARRIRQEAFNSEREKMNCDYILTAHHANDNVETILMHLDDGCGMDSVLLRKSLRFGDGNRFARRGMGRFGVGLPQGSLHQADEITVWSWQAGQGNAQMVPIWISMVAQRLRCESAELLKLERVRISSDPLLPFQSPPILPASRHQASQSRPPESEILILRGSNPLPTGGTGDFRMPTGGTGRQALWMGNDGNP